MAAVEDMWAVVNQLLVYDCQLLLITGVLLIINNGTFSIVGNDQELQYLLNTGNSKLLQMSTENYL